MATPAMAQEALDPLPGATSLSAAAAAAAAAAVAAQDRKKRKECEAEGCSIVPVFNFPNESSGRFCKQHRCAPKASIALQHYLRMRSRNGSLRCLWRLPFLAVC